MRVDGAPISGGIFDFALYFFHNAKELLARGTGPYFYLPKLESHLEARLWNDIFVMAQDELGMPQRHDQGDRADRDHPRRLRDGRDPLRAARALGRPQLRPLGLHLSAASRSSAATTDFCLADRAQVTMTTPFMRTYALLLIKTCHRRDVHAMGGMAAQIPIKNDAAANDEAIAKVQADKEREATDGHDGTWVAHPGLVPVAKEVVRPADADAEPDRASKRDDVNVDAPRTCSTSSPRSRSPRPACASTSTSASSTSAPGSRATAACRSST